MFSATFKDTIVAHRHRLLEPYSQRLHAEPADTLTVPAVATISVIVLDTTTVAAVPLANLWKKSVTTIFLEYMFVTLVVSACAFYVRARINIATVQ